MKKTGLLALCLLFSSGLFADEGPDYSKGVFILNEDWFGHQNSTVNFLNAEGEWEYRVFQKENPGKELGCTAAFGSIFGGRMYIISKQAQDLGSDIKGGRITVCNAQTMACIKQIEHIAADESGKSMADGRSFAGIDSVKGYVSTSNGIYVFDLEKLEVGKMIDSTGSDDGGLYSNQCGTMLVDSNRVFAIHQTKGLLIIDAGKDSVVCIIGAPTDSVNGKAVKRGYGSIVQSKDGMMWLSVCGDVAGRGSTVDYFMKFDPETFDTLRIALPEGYGLPSSWYAWTADAFCASRQQNKLYWKKNAGWFSNSQIICYDIDRNECSLFFDAQETGWYIYCGAGFRLHPQTDEMYVSLYLDNLKQTYQTVKLNTEGQIVASYEMIDNYWFPSMPLFPVADSGSLPENPGGPDEPLTPGDSVANQTHIRCGVSFYPNPARGAVYAKGEYERLQVYDLAGRLLDTYSGTRQIPIHCKPGIYFFHVTDRQGNKAVYKIIFR